MFLSGWNWCNIVYIDLYLDAHKYFLILHLLEESVAAEAHESQMPVI